MAKKAAAQAARASDAERASNYVALPEAFRAQAEMLKKQKSEKKK